ncbi:MAG: tyrosine-protein phosphatase [Planctomycetes bacterium]|nr:tyrosine-protein phosphatase [Planctomycetota bacterium]
MARAGLDNLHRVSDELWRGSQPTADGFEQLRALGIRTVVCLRYFARSPNPPAPGLALVELPMTAWAPNEADLLAFLRVATDPQHTPVFVHCYHGADRTGLMCAAYRRVVQGWSADEALDELRGGGFGYHEIWDDIEELVRELDVERLQQELGGTAPSAYTGAEPPRSSAN